ncbi:hypothetical protein ABT001_24915 [Streptomyces sp. NPDC002793]|uniref:hypothetical protein n=1 Tax=Streptomyces sp. NPDC002793 TaxID=3154432 RepID=UPI0033232827
MFRQEEYQAKVRRAAQEQAAKKAAEREARRPVCTGCGATFTDERWEAAQGQAREWGTLKDSHPHLCDACKHTTVTATAGVQTTGRREHREPLPRWAGAEAALPALHPSSPVCRVRSGVHRRAVAGGGANRLGHRPRTPPDPVRGLRRRYVTDLQQAWLDEHPHQE